MPKKIEISHRTIIFTVLFLAFLAFLYVISDIILQVFVSLLIMTILNPTVSKLEKYKVPRVASVLIVYAIVIAVIILVGALMIPPLVEQTTIFAASLPRYFSELNLPFGIEDQFTSQITQVISQLPSQVIRIGVTVFSNIFFVFAVFIFALYFLLARKNLDSQMSYFLKKEHIEKIDRVLVLLERDLGGWARGQLFLMILVGTSTYIGLFILGVPFALPLALLAGILEIIPNLGPIAASVPVILVGFGVSPLTGFASAALAFLVQQVENYVFVPKVMEKSANVSPIITLISLLIGFRLAGIPGAILSIPVVITTRVILNEFVFVKKELL